MSFANHNLNFLREDENLDTSAVNADDSMQNLTMSSDATVDSIRDHTAVQQEENVVNGNQ